MMVGCQVIPFRGYHKEDGRFCTPPGAPMMAVCSGATTEKVGCSTNLQGLLMSTGSRVALLNNYKWL